MAEQEADTFLEGATLIALKIHAEEVVAPDLTEVEGALPILAWITKEEVAPDLKEVESTLPILALIPKEEVVPDLTEVEGTLPILAWIPKEEVASDLTEVEGTLPILAWTTKNIQTQTQYTNGGAAITLGSLVDHKSKIHTIRNPKYSCMHRSLTTLLIQNNRINRSNYTKSARLRNAKVFSIF